MDVQRYISSGIIESYVVGLVSEQEAREMEQAMELYPEVRAAVEACRQDMEHYVQLHAAAPPQGIREKILDIMDNESQPEGAALLPEELREPQGQEPFSQNGQAPAARSQRWYYAALGAVLLLLASLVLNWLYGSRYKAYKARYEALLAAQSAGNAQQQKLQAALQEARRELALFKDPGFKWVRLLGAGKYTGQLATVGWNPQSKEVYVLAQALPEPAPGKQYQLWALVNKKPVNAGVFQAGERRSILQKMKAIAAAQAFLVTLENAGGNLTPSLDKVHISAKIN